MEKKFHQSVAARNIFAQYSHTVTDSNYFATAKLFLDTNNQDDYISAIKHAAKDLKFIEEDLPAIEHKYKFICEVEDEMDKSSCAKDQFTPLKERFEQMYSTNIVANNVQMAQITQQIKDLYFSLMKHYAEQMTLTYIDLQERLSGLKGKLDAYPKQWNNSLYNQINELVKICEKNRINQVVLNGNSTKCAKSGFILRDMIYALSQYSGYETQLAVMETEVVTTDPNPHPVPEPGPQTPSTPTPQPAPRPKVRSMKNKMPSGKLSVTEYRQWLKQQLSMVNGFDATDSLDFDN